MTTAHALRGDEQPAEVVRRPSLTQLLAWYLLVGLAALPSYTLIARLIYGLARIVARNNQRVLRRNIAMIWGLPWQSSFAVLFAKQVMQNQIITALETIKIIMRPDSLKIEGYDELVANLGAQEKAGLGQLVITAHLGSWELVGHLCAKAASQPFYALAKPSRSQLLTAVLDRLRQRMGTQVLWTGGKALPRQMLTALKQGSWLGFVMDQKPLGRQGPTVDFFGRPTAFVAGPATMALKEKRPVVAVFCVRLGPLHYRLLSNVLLPAHHAGSDLQAITQMMASEIERAIRLYPEQWCWDYKRWRFTEEL